MQDFVSCNRNKLKKSHMVWRSFSLCYKYFLNSIPNFLLQKQKLMVQLYHEQENVHLHLPQPGFPVHCMLHNEQLCQLKMSNLSSNPPPHRLLVLSLHFAMKKPTNAKLRQA